MIKTYPLQFTSERLEEIEQVAGKRRIKAFILEAIDEKMEREQLRNNAVPEPENDNDGELI
jgi:hypothetical protein